MKSGKLTKGNRRYRGYGMKAASSRKITQEMIDSPHAKDLLNNVYRDMLGHFLVDLLMKSTKPIKVKTRMGYTNDDFIQDMYTILMEAKVYRIPRIVKNMVIKNLKSGRDS